MFETIFDPNYVWLIQDFTPPREYFVFVAGDFKPFPAFLHSHNRNIGQQLLISWSLNSRHFSENSNCSLYIYILHSLFLYLQYMLINHSFEKILKRFIEEINKKMRSLFQTNPRNGVFDVVQRVLSQYIVHSTTCQLHLSLSLLHVHWVESKKIKINHNKRSIYSTQTARIKVHAYMRTA